MGESVRQTAVREIKEVRRWMGGWTEQQKTRGCVRGPTNFLTDLDSSSPVHQETNLDLIPTTVRLGKSMRWDICFRLGLFFFGSSY